MTTSKAIGIDLGNTNSRVSVFKNGRVEIIANAFSSLMTPSCVAFGDNEILVGEAAREQLVGNASNTVYGLTRMIGRRFADQCVQDDMKQWPFKVVAGKVGQAMVEVNYKGETEQYTPEYLSSLVLGKMKSTAETHLGHTVTDAVITIPINYGDAQQRATGEAARLAGLNVLRIVNEPTAAALAYKFVNIASEEKPRTILVFNLGSGTLDVSILSVDENNEFEVKATAGNPHLGGDDFDNRLLAHFSEEFKRKYAKDLSSDKRAMRRLWATCERAKRQLSENAVSFVVADNLHSGCDFECKIQRGHFDTMCVDLFDNMILTVQMALNNAKLDTEAIDQILMVGGASRVPKVQQILQEYFAGRRVIKSINPEEAIPYGAAILAAKLSGAAVSSIQKMTLYDVIAVSLSIANHKGQFLVQIPAGSQIPVTVKREWCTKRDYTTKSRFDFYECENSSDANHFLGSVKISNYPPRRAGEVKFDLVMEFDANSYLHVSVTWKLREEKNRLTTKTSNAKKNLIGFHAKLPTRKVSSSQN